jgi:hypothetical protein
MMMTSIIMTMPLARVVVVVVVVMPFSTPVVTSMPVTISPTPVAIIDDGRGSVIAGRFVNHGGRRPAPAEWIEINIEMYARIGR